MSSGRNTQEYQKVKKSFPKIAAAIAGVIGPTSNELLAAGLITNGQKEKARNSTRDADDRASDLVSLILNKIEQDSQNFYAFVRVLKEDLDTFQTVLDHMGVSTGKLDIRPNFKIVLKYASWDKFIGTPDRSLSWIE